MSFHKTYRNSICSDVASITYHFYKKGVVDGSESGDEWAIKSITENTEQTFKFMSEFSQKSIKFGVLFEFVQSQFSYIKPRAIHHWFFKVSGSYNIKNPIVLICYEYYKLGLVDGLKTRRNDVKEFIQSQSKFAFIGEKRKSEEYFLMNIKMTARTIQIDGYEMEYFIAFLATSIKNRKDYYFKVKNELL